MTGPGEDSQKQNPEDAAKYLAESFFGLNLSPADVGGEVLFDDYDDNQSTTAGHSNQPQGSAGRIEEIQAFASVDSGSSGTQSAPNPFEENLDDLIVFGDDDDDDDNVSVRDDEDEEDDDENFDFGEEDDEDEDEEEDDDEFEDDDEEEEEEEEDELDDEELDFGADVIDPAPKKGMPVARDSRSGRDDRGTDSRPAPSRSNAPRPAARPMAESREEQRSASGRRDGGRREKRPAAHSDRPSSRDERPAAARGDRRDERPAARGDERPPQRGGRPQESTVARSDSRGSERAPASAADAGRKSPPGDDDYWKELDGWVWEDDAQKKPVASRPVAAVEDIDDEDIDDDDDDVVTPSPAAESDDDGESPKRRRGRRRGGRGRGRGRRDRPETSAPAADEINSASDAVDFDDFSEILFEEDQEDFVSVSAGSVKAQRRIQDEPPSPAARMPEPVEIDDEDESDDVERSEAADEDRPARSRRGRRGRRGRGKGPEETREPVRAEERPAASARRPVRNEADMEDDDIEDDDLELSDFGDEDDDEEEVPHRRDRSRAEPARGESSRIESPRGERAPRGERPQPGTSGRGRDRGEPEPRVADSADRPRRQAPREPRPAVAAGEDEGRRGPRPPRVAAEFQDIPTWEEAIGSLAIRTPTEEHARRTENRGRRDGGGRPPRRRN